MSITIDPAKVQFDTISNVDKVAFYSLSASSSGIGAGGVLTVLAGSTASPQVSYGSVANPYAKRCLMTFSWSLDQTNWYPMNVPIFYYDSGSMAYSWKCLGFAGCSDSTIYFCATSQYTSNQSMYVQFAGSSPS